VKCDNDDDEKIIGMVKARDLLDLWMSVDEVFNPHEMQYLSVKGEGGILLHDGELLTTENFLEQRTVEGGPRWKTFVELAGGERLFHSMYKKWHAVK
jgi:hypothetical protein